MARACQLDDAPSPSSATEPFFAVKESSSTLDVSASGEGSKGALDGGNFTSHTERKPSFEGRMAASKYSVTEWGMLAASTGEPPEDSSRPLSTVHAETRVERSGEKVRDDRRFPHLVVNEEVDTMVVEG